MTTSRKDHDAVNEMSISRRQLIKMTGAGVTVAALGVAVGAPSAFGASSGVGQAPRTTITDLGPAHVAFSLMSGVKVGEVMYIGSRNLSPTRIAAYHLPSKKVIASTTLGPGKFVQGMAADPSGRHLYAGIVYDKDTDQPNLFCWDLTTPEVPATAVARIPGLDVRRVTVAPDGMVYVVGMEADPGIWEVDPRTGSFMNIGIPDPNATQSRAVAATDTTVYFGAGSNLSGGDGASKASLFAVDRATHQITPILPAAMAEADAVRDIEVIGDRLYVGTEGSSEFGKFGYVELANPTVSGVFETDGKSVKLFREHDGTIYFAAGGGVSGFSVAERVVVDVDTQGISLGEIWGLDYDAGQVVVVSAGGYIAEVDPTSGGVLKTDLVEAGAPSDLQLGMSIAVGGGYIYVGGNGSMARHSLADGVVTSLEFPGESKDGVVVDGVLYTGQYSSEGIWSYDPRTGEPPHQAIDLPQEQNRPQDVYWDDVNRLLLVGVQCDSQGGGSLAIYDPVTDRVDLHVNPFDQYQMVRTVTASKGIAYLGGENPYKTGPRGEVSAWDPVSGKQLWRIDPEVERGGITNIVVNGRYLYCLCVKGEFFVVDLPTRQIVHRADLGKSLVPGQATLILSRGTVYGVSAASMFAFDRKTFEMSVVIPDLNGEWYSMPRVDADADGVLYTLRHRNLVKVDDHR
ncbi:MAG: PQQ-binding-like beta-propeller repeat protein [Microbacterium sp.]|jgi:hypothetical protein|nr:PQQ-binding-like beta-propeller repeat protein [Microbacterium sp.]